MKDTPGTPSMLETWLVRRISEMRGIAPSSVDVREPFSRYGLESVDATQIIAELSQALGRPLSPTLAWEYPSIGALARHLGGDERKPAQREVRPHGARANEPIAIVGMACRLPRAPDLDAFWELLAKGACAITEIPRDRWDVDAFYDRDPGAPGKMNTRWGGFLDRVDGFEPLFFGISPREAAQMDPQQRLMLELSWEALEDAGILPGRLQRSPTGAFFGAAWTDYAVLRERAGLSSFDQYTVPGSHHSIIANRVSYVLGLEGPSMAVDTACSSSLVAVHLACESLRRGECTLALAGGVNLNLVVDSTLGVGKFGALSPDGRCFTFDARANGYVRGEGGGVVVLKPLSRALAEGDCIHAIVLGGAVNNDGASNGLTAPNPRAQEALLRTAHARAGVDALSIDYVEAHGTGTQLGDPIEVGALGAVLGEGRRAQRPLLVGSVKPNIGHLEAAAGVASLIKLVLCLERRQIPPSIHFENPNPLIPFHDLHVEVQRRLAPWPEGADPPRAGVSAFGFGGTNCHLVLEAWGPPRAALRESIEGILERGVVPARRWASAPVRRRAPDIVFVFSGQGSQWIGMGRALLREEPVFRTALERCNAVIEESLGYSLLDELLAEEGTSRLGEPEVSVPAVVALQIALTELWRSWGVEPAAVVGHSSGESAAAFAAGALDLPDAMRVACVEGRLLQRIRGRGAMGVVGLGWESVGELVRNHGGRLSRAIHVSPAEVVLSGDPAALDEVFEALERKSVFCRRANVDAAPHSPQIDPLRGELVEALRAVHPRPASVPIHSSVTGARIDGEQLDAAHWARNLGDPVLFAEALASVEIEEAVFLEISPHPVVGRAIAANLAHVGRQGAVLFSLRRGEDERAVLLASLGALHALGWPGHWDRISREAFEALRKALPIEEESRGAEERPAESQQPVRLLPLSARTPEALHALARSYRNHLDRTSPEELRDIAYTASVRREHDPHRLALVGATGAEIGVLLEAFLRGESPPGVTRGIAERTPLPVVFVFPGQGSQWLGMGRDLLVQERSFRSALEACDRVIREEVGWSVLVELEADGADSRLERIDVVQPVLFALEVALAALWRSWGVMPDAVVGHSMGEVAAAHVAGALTLKDAARVICRRSRLLRRVSGQGAMALVDVPLAQARELVAGGADRLAVAVCNSLGSTVLAGDPGALEELLSRLGRANVPCRRIKVDVASHSPQMDPLLGELRAALGAITPVHARVPMHSTVSGERCRGPELGADYWARNLREPVLFAQTIARIVEGGPALFIEMSPHPILLPAIEETLQATREKRRGAAVGSLRRDKDAGRALLESLGVLHVHGCPVDFRGLHPAAGRVVRLPAHSWQRKRYWIDAAPEFDERSLDTERTFRESLLAAPEEQRRRLVEEALAVRVGGALRLSPEAIAVTTSLRALGVDSLLAMELRNRILDELSVELPASRIFLAEGIRGLATEILERMQEQCAAQDAASAVEAMETGEL